MYGWKGMEKIDFSEAMERFRDGKSVYLLYSSNFYEDAESLVSELSEIENHEKGGGEFGYER